MLMQIQIDLRRGCPRLVHGGSLALLAILGCPGNRCIGNLADSETAAKASGLRSVCVLL